MTDKANRTVTRRRVIAGTAIALGGLALSGARSAAQEKSANAGAIIATRAIHQEEDFNASAQRIYEILLDSKQFTAFSGGRAAEIHSEVGHVLPFRWPHCGRNLELVPNQRIVQAWRVVPWPEGFYSIAGLNWWDTVRWDKVRRVRVPQLALSLTTLASLQNLRSTWRAVGARTIGTRCGSTWL